MCTVRCLAPLLLLVGLGPAPARAQVAVRGGATANGNPPRVGAAIDEPGGVVEAGFTIR